MAPELLSVSDQPEADFWNLEQGYKDAKHGGDRTAALDAYPHRVFGNGRENSLIARFIQPSKNLDLTCRATAQGYKVVLHAPSEIPQPSMNFFRLPHDQEILASVKLNMLESSEELQDYPPNRKQCYLNSQIQLKFFKVYTQHHCELECISNRMKDACGCVFFSYPSKGNVSLCANYLIHDKNSKNIDNDFCCLWWCNDGKETKTRPFAVWANIFVSLELSEQ